MSTHAFSAMESLVTYSALRVLPSQESFLMPGRKLSYEGIGENWETHDTKYVEEGKNHIQDPLRGLGFA